MLSNLLGNVPDSSPFITLTKALIFPRVSPLRAVTPGQPLPSPSCLKASREDEPRSPQVAVVTEEWQLGWKAKVQANHVRGDPVTLSFPPSPALPALFVVFPVSVFTFHLVIKQSAFSQ